MEAIIEKYIKTNFPVKNLENVDVVTASSSESLYVRITFFLMDDPTTSEYDGMSIFMESENSIKNELSDYKFTELYFEVKRPESKEYEVEVIIEL